jgi:uncharacterized membrane protein (DUF106 family)
MMAYTFLNPIFDPVLGPLLNLNAFWIIFVIALLATLIITIIYKLVTDQELMKRLKHDQKEMQKRMKTLREHPEKLAAFQKEMWGKNMEYMRHSFKPTLFTFIPILILFGWLSAHLAYAPLLPAESFDVNLDFYDNIVGDVFLEAEGLEIVGSNPVGIEDNKAAYTLSGKKGRYILEFNHDDKIYEKKILITSRQDYEPPVNEINDGTLKKISVVHREMKPLGNFSLFGWRPGWFGTYFLLSIVLTMGIRKLFGVH